MQLNEIHNKHEHATVSLKTLLLIFAVVLIGALGYMIRDFQQTSYDTESSVKATTTEAKNDATKDWQTYTHATLNFSVMHPADWKITTPEIDFSALTPGSGISVLFIENKERAVSMLESSETGLAENVVFYWKDALKDTTFDAWFEKNASVKEGEGTYGTDNTVTRSNLTVTDTTIGTYTAKLQRYLTDHGANGTMIEKNAWIAVNNDVYAVSFETKSPDSKKLEATVFDNLYKTFSVK